MDAATGKLILDGVLNLASVASERNFAKARYKVHAAEIAANKAIREANNKAKAAHGSLLRYKDVLSKRIMAKNYGQLQNTMTSNLVRANNNNLNVRQYLGIQAAENEGALAASVAASGIGGGTADQLQAISSLRFAERTRQVNQAAAVDEENLRNQLNSSYESFVNNQGIDYRDDNLSFLEEVNQAQVPSVGSQLFKAFISTVGGNTDFMSNAFVKPKEAVTASTSKGFFNIDSSATSFGSALIGL